MMSTFFRSQGEKKHVMVFRVMKSSCDEENDAHLLEVEHAKLKVNFNTKLKVNFNTKLKVNFNMLS